MQQVEGEFVFHLLRFRKKPLECKASIARVRFGRQQRVGRLPWQSPRTGAYASQGQGDQTPPEQVKADKNG